MLGDSQGADWLQRTPASNARPAAERGETMTARLEDLKPDALVKGLVGREAVRIVCSTKEM